jgi:glycosyltransferase involved in cell wall biosynthesis
MTKISIIIPAYNEEENIKRIYQALKDMLIQMNKTYEIIFVDDGSIDKTREEINKVVSSDENVKGIIFQRNFGKAAGLAAGWQAAQGDLIVQMDADLQDDPKEIPRFIEKINQGYDLVSGWKYKRYDPITKTFPSKIFNWLVSKVTGVKLHDINCGFKCYKREVIKNIRIYGELHRFIPTLADWKGFKVGEIKVKHHSRKFGKSKYGFTRFFKGLCDLATIKYLTQYNNRPLHFFGLIGFLFSLLGFVSGAYLVYLKIIGDSISNRPLLFLTVLLIFLGAQFFSLGLIAEMLTSKDNKDPYVIREVIKK